MKSILATRSKLWMRIRSNHIIYSGLTTSGLVTLGKGLAFMIPVVVAWAFGVNQETDAFFLVYGIVFFAISIFSSAAESVLVPFIADTIDQRQETKRLLNNILLITTILLIPLTAAVVALGRVLIPLVTSISGDSIQLIFRILIEMSPLVLLVSWVSIFNGVLNAYGIFWLPALSPAARGIIVIISALAFGRSLGIHSVTLGYVLAELVRLFASAYAVRRLGILSLKISLSIDSRTKSFFKASLFQIVGTASIGFNPVVDRLFASYAGNGAITLLEYARNLFYAGIGVMTTGFFIVILTDWSRLFSQEDFVTFRRRVNTSGKVVLAGTIIASIILWLIRSPIVFTLYGGGLTQEQGEIVIRLFGLFILGTLPFVMSSFYARVHLAMKNTKILMQTALITTIFNLIFNFVLFRLLSLQGLVLASGLTYTIAFYWVYRKYRMVTNLGQTYD